MSANCKQTKQLTHFILVTFIKNFYGKTVPEKIFKTGDGSSKFKDDPKLFFRSRYKKYNGYL